VAGFSPFCLLDICNLWRSWNWLLLSKPCYSNEAQLTCNHQHWYSQSYGPRLLTFDIRLIFSELSHGCIDMSHELTCVSRITTSDTVSNWIHCVQEFIGDLPWHMTKWTWRNQCQENRSWTFDVDYPPVNSHKSYQNRGCKISFH